MHDNLYVKTIKKIFHVNKSISTSQILKANEIGANAFIYLYFYTVFSSLLLTILSVWIPRRQLFGITLLLNIIIIVLLIGSLYVHQSLSLLGIKFHVQNQNTRSLLVSSIKRTALVSVVFWLIILVLNQLTFYSSILGKSSKLFSSPCLRNSTWANFVFSNIRKKS